MAISMRPTARCHSLDLIQGSLLIDRSAPMSTSDLLLYMAVVWPFAIGTAGAVYTDDPSWLIAGLIPAFIWGRIEARWRG